MTVKAKSGAPADRHDAQATARTEAAPSTSPPRPHPDPLPNPVFIDCPELACLRDVLPPAVLARAARRAHAIGVDADRVLIASRDIDEQTYVHALARSLQMVCEPLDFRSRNDCPVDDDRLVQAAVTGLLPVNGADGVMMVVAPSLAGSRRIVEAAASTEFRTKVRLTTRQGLQRFVTRKADAHIARHAAFGLPIRRPGMSAAHVGSLLWQIVALALLVAAFILAMPTTATMVLEILLATVFVGWTGLRVLSILSTPAPDRRFRVNGDHDLPVYTVIVALYREAAALPTLAQALARFDYPPEKLDLKLVLEEDDEETLAAVRSLWLGAPFEIVIAPPVGPRTKPKALNAALMLARGAFVTVYDAEDRPEPDQLRLALGAFAAGDRRLACVQARLTIDNAADSWLTRLFTAEYAGLFDVMLPGLSGWRLPLPLGGSSNHFRTDVLRAVGGWDAYNVTEDADLGMRLARFGYRTAVIASTTYEEAPARMRPWLQQRTRWMKGWMQIATNFNFKRIFKSLEPIF